jgi:hypothetical protein
LLKVAAALSAVGADYFLGGSLASSLQGEPRATNDIDFVIALPVGKINALRDALGEDFEVDTDMLRDAVLRARCANAFYLPVVTKVDFSAEAMSRSTTANSRDCAPWSYARVANR